MTAREKSPSYGFGRRAVASLVVGVFAAALCLTGSGCSRKIAKPDAPDQTSYPSGVFGGPSSGSVTEQEMQGVQARLHTVYFDYDSFTLSPDAQTALQGNSDTLKAAPHVRVVVEGHCDERGADEYNLALGERRARSVVGYLAGLGVSPDRLSTVSYGSELPLDPGHNESAYAKNRRAFLRIVQ
jgi:peptidoglycan-associated lipoprotein